MQSLRNARMENALPPEAICRYILFHCSKEHLHQYQREQTNTIHCLFCNAVFAATPFLIRVRKKKYCSRRCQHEHARQQRENDYAQGIVTKHEYERSMRYGKAAQDWRKAIFERDDYTCQHCHIRGTYLEADHIKPFAFFPALRFELSNGRTLCRPCHDKTKISYKLMRQQYATQNAA